MAHGFEAGSQAASTAATQSIGMSVGGQSGATSAGSVYSTGNSDHDSLAKYSKESVKKASNPVPGKKKRMEHVRVVNSPKGHRVKLVGANLGELAPIFVKWADRLDKDLRVVNTQGEAAYQFYGKPMVAGRIGANALCLFLTGSMNSEIINNGTKWRVGMDELLALKAPPKLDSAEFPSFANIQDEKKVFIGRVDGKMIYTMLYVPMAEMLKNLNGNMKATEPQTPNEAPPKPEQYVDNPRALEPFIDHVMAKYERIARDNAAELRGDLTERSFREYCGDSQRKRERSLQDVLDRTNREIKEIEERMLKKARELRDAQKEMALCKSGALDKELGDQARKMNKLVEDGLFVKFKVRHGFLVGLTEEITIEHDKKQHALGRFMISIDKDGKVKMESENRPHPAHPHLRTDGGFCLGNIGQDVPKLIGMERYAMAFTILHEFLSSYNPHDRVTALEICSGARAETKMVDEAAPEAAPQGMVPPGGRPIPSPGMMPSPPLGGDISRPIARSQEAAIADINRAVNEDMARAIGIPRDAMEASKQATRGGMQIDSFHGSEVWVSEKMDQSRTVHELKNSKVAEWEKSQGEIKG